MSNVVGFLEALSLDTRRMSETEYAEAVEAAGFSEAVQHALLERDASALNAVAGARATVLAFIFPAEDEPESPDTDEPGDEPKDGEHDAHRDALAA